MRKCCVLAIWFGLFLLVPGVAGLVAAESAWKEIPRVLPPEGIKITAAERKELTDGVIAVRQRISRFPAQKNSGEPGSSGPLALSVMDDVEIFAKAMQYALDFDEFYKPQDVGVAKECLKIANVRLDAFGQPKSQQPWLTQRGPVALAYRSSIDDSLQPFGVVVPEKLDLSQPAPLYVWLHGRGDKDTDMHFLRSKNSSGGEIKTDKAIVLHPFGRQCVGYKSAGEVDIFEAIESVKKRYKIDQDKIVLMGFSMGGAGAWHVGAHYAERFAGVHAGAGFVDVLRYQHLTKEKLPPAYEQTLWGLYDVPDYTRNLFNVPMLAYSGEIDKQKESADIMAEAFKIEGKTLTRLIGPGMGHKYDPASKENVLQFADQCAASGRTPNPAEVHLQTRTLRYNAMKWVEVTALERHWQDSRVDAAYQPDGQLVITTKNIVAFQNSKPKLPRAISIDGQTVDNTQFYRKQNGKWMALQTPLASQGKSPGLQGPIDDAFMSAFLFVLPSSKSKNRRVQQWVDFESAHQIKRWRELFRGDVRIKKDIEVTESDAAKYNLILWGDPASNSLIASSLKFLPLAWDEKTLKVAGQEYAAVNHLPIMIYPNRAAKSNATAPPTYVVLNSGPTFREAHDHTNSLQNPKLPDWAVIDLNTPPDAEKPGKIVAADFFDEQWHLPIEPK